MGKFEDEIRKKLEEGQVDYSSSSWEQMDKDLSEQISYTPFEKKIQDSFSTGIIPVSPGSWDDFSNNFNSLDSFEKKVSEKLEKGKIKLDQSHWEEFSEKLSNSKLTPLERNAKAILNSKEIAYNHSHWRAFEKALNSARNKKFFWRSAAAILLLFGSGFGINQIIKEPQKTERNLNVNDASMSPTDQLSLIKENTKLEFEKKGSKIDYNNPRILKQSNNKPPSSNKSTSLVKKGTGNKKGRFLDLNKTKGAKTTNSTPPSLPTENKGDKEYVDFENVLVKKISIGFKRVEMCEPFELITKQVVTREKPRKNVKLHAGATMWVNFWDNPAITGFYSKNNISAFYFNDWEVIDVNRDKLGELNFVQPLVYLGGYERRLNQYWSVGGSYKYQLKKNWNNREFNASLSYTKTILNNLEIKLGAGATYQNHNLAVNKLTLREKAINSNYIFTTELGDLRSQQEHSTVYHVGGFVNHKNFFAGYSALNFESSHFSNENDITLTHHAFTGGMHLPEFNKTQITGLLKIEKELFRTYSPAIGITYNNQLFTNFEYKDLSAKRITIGYQLKNRMKAQFNYSIRDLEDYQKDELNLDNFTERKGSISAGLNYTF